MYSEDEQEQDALENAHEKTVNDSKIPGQEYILDDFKKEVMLTLVNRIYNINQNGWKKLHENNAEKRIVLAYNFFFNRYEPVIGFYFRHLYHILKYIKKEKEGWFDEKNCGRYAEFSVCRFHSCRFQEFEL